MSAPIGMLKFAPPVDAQGSMFSVRRRMEARGVTLAGEEPAAVIREGGVS